MGVFFWVWQQWVFQNWQLVKKNFGKNQDFRIWPLKVRWKLFSKFGFDPLRFGGLYPSSCGVLFLKGTVGSVSKGLRVINPTVRETRRCGTIFGFEDWMRHFFKRNWGTRPDVDHFLVLWTGRLSRGTQRYGTVFYFLVVTRDTLSCPFMFLIHCP